MSKKELTILEILHNTKDELERAKSLLTERDDYGTETLTDTDVLVGDIDVELDRISDAECQIIRAIKIALEVGFLTCLSQMSSMMYLKQEVYDKILEEAATHKHEENVAYKIVANIRYKKVM